MLKVVAHEPRSLRWWYEQHLLGRIDLNPTYQRRADIWNRWKRAHLIDSVINDFDMPKFYVANFALSGSEALNEHDTRYAIIDGKQRFGAIFSFFDDVLALNASTVLDDDASCQIGKLRYSELVMGFPHISAKIESFIPAVMNVITDDDHKIEELFIRLNAGEAATGAERRNAMGGPVPAMVRELALHSFVSDKIGFSVKRMQEHNLLVKLLLLEFKGAFVDTKAKNLDDFAVEAQKWDKGRAEGQQEGMGAYGAARDRVYDTLDLLSAEFRKRDPLLSRQGEIPIYYWLVRQHPGWTNELRDFVLEFSERLLENLRLTRTNPDQGDPELSAYYTMARTTNDQGSLAGRYRIFHKRFLQFRRPLGRLKP